MLPTLTSVLGNAQRLDGGAMFGNAPRALWTRWATPDEKNRIPLACRTLLVREPSRLVLLETGIGAYMEPALADRYGVVESTHVLLENLAGLGLSHEDIDVVVLSHLHFDHAGGLLSPWKEGAAPELLFPRARFVVGRDAWERANAPHPRDRASFIPTLQPLLEKSGRLEIVEGETSEVLGDGYRFHLSDGHTPGLLLTEVDTARGPVVFAADLVPGVPWVHVPITMGYDRWPERLIDEKTALLTDLEARGGWLFFTHDPEVALGKVQRNEKGRFGVVETVGELNDAAPS
jgi:glyoxylase-like metal-dependent hydrolase (beta-lactamase superfamily II)